jgi:hypothetical protein
VACHAAVICDVCTISRGLQEHLGLCSVRLYVCRLCRYASVLKSVENAISKYPAENGVQHKNIRLAQDKIRVSRCH